MAASEEFARRLAQLPAERRALVQRMLEQRADVQTPSPKAAPVARAQERLSLDIQIGGSEHKAGYRRFYDQVSCQLDTSEFGAFSIFLNYGYAANEEKRFAQVTLPEHYLNRNSVQLVLELVGDRSIDGKDILDVGCGRGGTIATLKEFFAPATLTGIDLSSEATAFNRRTHTDPRCSFHEGDAEDLPFDDASFDTVVNVESSHSYPEINRFYAETCRVLKPGGWFLYTDLLPREQWDVCRAKMIELGLAPTHDRDITRNVILSCDQIARSRVAAFSANNDAAVMRDFLATPGSAVYQSMADHTWHYRIFWCVKHAG
jgi:phthiocerol/phenolphthiocerol synthesis type-I polyketide synthase E